MLETDPARFWLGSKRTPRAGTGKLKHSFGKAGSEVLVKFVQVSFGDGNEIQRRETLRLKRAGLVAEDPRMGCRWGGAREALVAHFIACMRRGVAARVRQRGDPQSTRASIEPAIDDSSFLRTYSITAIAVCTIRTSGLTDEEMDLYQCSTV